VKVLLVRESDSAGYWKIFAGDLNTDDDSTDCFSDNYQHRIKTMDRERLAIFASFTFDHFRAFTHAYGIEAEDCKEGDCPVWKRLLEQKEEIMTKVASGEIDPDSLARGTAKVTSLYDGAKRIDSALWEKFQTCARIRLDDASWKVPLRWTQPGGKRDTELDGTADEENPLACALREFREETELTTVPVVRDTFAVFRQKKREACRWSMNHNAIWPEDSTEREGEEWWRPENTEISMCRWFTRAEIEAEELQFQLGFLPQDRHTTIFSDKTILLYSFVRIEKTLPVERHMRESGGGGGGGSGGGVP